MGRYRQARNRLRDLLQAQLQHHSKVGGQRITPRLQQALSEEAEDLLDEFESLAEGHGYRRGVWQSFWGSWLFTFSIGIIGIALYGLHQNFVDLVDETTSVFKSPKHEQKTLLAPTLPSPPPTATL